MFWIELFMVMVKNIFRYKNNVPQVISTTQTGIATHQLQNIDFDNSFSLGITTIKLAECVRDLD